MLVPHVRRVCFMAVLLTGCLSPWEVGGPFACSAQGTCATGFTCDDGVCCKPGGSPACPTLPSPNNTCSSGAAPQLWFVDADQDGFGNPRLASERCARPLLGTWSTTGTDCDDTQPSVHPGGAEQCDGRDNNCDGVIDEGLTPQTPFFPDLDGDGFGAGTALSACAAPPGHVTSSSDCAPFDPTKFPGAPETCNGLDDNCNGVRDLDEPASAFADVDSPAHALPCLTTQPGQCQHGVFRCAAEPDGGVQRTCAALQAPSREVCDGVDNDCDGLVDEPPDCGGPTSLLNVPGATYAAQRLTSTTNLSTHCQKNEPGVAETALPNGTWQGSTAGAFHVWSVEAPPGQLWDLSNPNATMSVIFSATSVGRDATRGAWGNPATGDGFNPVVYLCGSDTELMRYRLISPTDAFKLDDTAFSRSLQLKAVGTPWLIGQASGFDTTQVKRVELVVYSYATSFTISLAPDAGFSR
jgi:hypothetical protein